MHVIARIQKGFKLLLTYSYESFCELLGTCSVHKKSAFENAELALTLLCLYDKHFH